MTMELDTILCGDSLNVLKALPESSVHCCVTSPPYYGLRDYGMDAQIGREATPEEYISRLTAVFREVRRVLRPDGTLWVNIADSYCGTGSKGDTRDPKYPQGRNGQNISLCQAVRGCKQKDMIGIPWMLAFALRADGWYLRNDVIWAKGNPMPESTKDRCTRSHEHIFMLTKSRRYFYDWLAIAEPIAPTTALRKKAGRGAYVCKNPECFEKCVKKRVFDRVFQEKLSEGEKTLAAYILAHGMEIAKYSTRSLAEVTYTSPPTVLRLCKKLGFTGFDDFKQNFVRELEYLDQQQGKVDFNFPFAENDSPMRVAQNIGELYEEAVKDTMQLLRYEDLHKAVLLLKYHEEIHIFSAGTAINQAESFREKMLKIGKRVVIFNNLNYQRYQACCLSERDLAMIISYSGETAQMLEIARQCKRSGTPILALTSFGENSLTCYADCKLTLSTKESIYQNLGDYASHLSMTLLLDILYSEYFRQNYQKNYTYKLERARELEQHRTSTNPILLNLHKENAE